MVHAESCDSGTSKIASLYASPSALSMKKSKLTGAPIQAYDLRAGAALVIAALAAEGESEISNVQYIERGYEDIIGKLRALGADIRAVEEPDEDVLSTAQIS